MHQAGTLVLDVGGRVFVGGVPSEVLLPPSLEALGFARTFEGCVANVTVDTLALVPDEAGAVVARRGVTHCTSVALVAPGANVVFFGVLPAAATAGPNTLAFQFFTHRSDAALVYLPGRFGTSHFLLLALVAGRITLQQDFGDGIVTVSLSSGNR